VRTGLKEIIFALAMPLLTLQMTSLVAQEAPTLSANPPAQATPPPSNGGFFPLSQVRRGMKATAWTVFSGTQPEPMDVEILGVLKGARGPGHDMILAQLHGAKPEYTGVVAGMSGSPVYIGNQLLGSLSYRIGQFSKDPIAGITPIEQMLEVRDLPFLASPAPDVSSTVSRSNTLDPPAPTASSTTSSNLQPMETPLVMSGFSPEAVRLWQQQMAGTGLEMVAAGGGSSASNSNFDPSAAISILPGSAVSLQLVRGDLEMAATCTVTYVDPKQLLACGHPVLQAGPVSLPMTKSEVLATLASPLNAFKIVNTGATIGAFTEDRDSAIRGIFGEQAKMIPVHIAVQSPSGTRKLNIEVLDLPSLTPQVLMIAVFQTLQTSNSNTAESSYHLTGNIDLNGGATPEAPFDLWAASGEQLPAPMQTALSVADRFNRLYANNTRQNAVRQVDLSVEVIPHRVQVELESARLISSNIVHAGESLVVEATLRPWQQPSRNVRIPITLPGRLTTGTLRLLISDAGTLDRTLNQPRPPGHTSNVDTEMTLARRQHPADRIYISILAPDTQAGIAGQTLTALPLSMANALETQRATQDVSLNGESAETLADAPATGVLSGFQILNLHIEPGGSF
jgi:hypothetical protein